MLFNRNLFWLGILLFCFSTPVFSQVSTSSIQKLVNEACAYYDNKDFEKSLIVSKIALNNATQNKNNYLIASSYKIIASNYNELLEHDKAIFFYNKSLIYANRLVNDTLKYTILNNLGNLYCFEKKQIQKGIDSYKKAIRFAYTEKDLKKVSLTNINLIWACFTIGAYKEGYVYLKAINDLKIKNFDVQTFSVINMLNGMYAVYTNNSIEADSYFKKAIELGEKNAANFYLSFAYLEYSKFLTNLKKYKEAYINLAFYNKVNNALNDKQENNKAAIAGKDVSLEEYKRNIDKVETEKAIQMKSLETSKIIFVLFVLISFVFLILIFTLYKNIVIKKKVNDELLNAKEIAEQASLLKTQFISTISHELRTPLYGVVGITNMLLEEHKEKSNNEHLNSLKFSASYLLSLVNDILHINKIEENRVVLENARFNIYDEIIMIKSTLSFLAKKNNNELLVNIDPDIPLFLMGDKLRLGQVLMNLVSNALKFTKNGEVVVNANLIKKEDDNYFVEFQVKDNGVGIAKADQSKIFDKFVQVGRKQEDYLGTGLGLSIVKRLLDLFGSTISLKSEIGKGTIFIFAIPFKLDVEKTRKSMNEIEFNLGLNQGYEILVVEDNRINQMVTRKILEKYHYSCTIVDDGFSAIDLLERQEFDVILMDINMPLINGFETTKKIRALGIKTPVIALTAFDKNEVSNEAILSGMTDVIVKPFEPLELFRVINYLILEQKNVG